jgi:hypothetical protein
VRDSCATAPKKRAGCRCGGGVLALEYPALYGQEMVDNRMLNQGAKQSRFGAGTDPVAAGRAGGIASGVARRLRAVRELERGVAESRNGLAKLSLLKESGRS